MNRVFEHVMFAVDLARFLALGQFGAVGGRAKKCADAGPRRADAFGQIALRHQLQLNLAAAVQAIEHLAVGLARKAADDLAYAPGLEQSGQSGFAIAGVVVDDGQVFGTLRNQAVNQLGGVAGSAEAANQYRRAVFDIGQRIGHRQGNLVDH